MKVDPDLVSPKPEDDIPESDSPAERPVAPRVGKEESILQAASEELTEAEAAEPDQPSRTVSVGTPIKKSHKKLLLSALAVVIIGGLVVGGLMLFRKPVKTPVVKTTESDVTSSSAQENRTYVPNTVAYAYRANTTDPYSVYYRPAAGGERKEVMKLERDEYTSVSDVVGNIVVFGSDTKLYVSDDAGKTYTNVYTAASGEAINSVKVSSDRTKVAVAVVPDFSNQSKGQVFSIDLNGKNKKTLFDDPSALYLIGWNNSKQKIAYWQGCYSCDGGRTGWKLRDLKSKAVRDLVKGVDPKTYYHQAAISDDMSTLMYVQSTYDAAIKVSDPPGYYSAAPYKVMKADLTTADNSGIDIATVGKKQEKNSNGTDKIRRFSLGFLAGTNDGYYAEGNKINLVSTEGTVVLYQADQDISAVHYASDKAVIVSTGDISSADFLLSNYDLVAKKSTQIFQGDANTSVFGVSTK